MNVVSDKERADILKRILSTPIGAGKRFLVKCGNDDCAGFDDAATANAYVAMMQKGKESKTPPGCAKLTWSVIDRGAK